MTSDELMFSAGFVSAAPSLMQIPGESDDLVSAFLIALNPAVTLRIFRAGVSHYSGELCPADFRPLALA